MNSHQQIPTVYHGKWRIPEKDDFRRQFSEYQECMGTLYYHENKPSKLEVYFEPKQGIIANIYSQYDVVWGNDANGYEFTLFNVHRPNPVQETAAIDFSKTEFIVDYVILGRHIKSMDEPVFDICMVTFPFLKNWAFQDNRREEQNGKLVLCMLNLDMVNPFLEIEIEKGVKIALLSYSKYISASYDTTVSQNTVLRITADKPIPTNSFMQFVFEFSQFLSIALFSNQSPSTIELSNRNEPERRAILLYEIEPSTKPYKTALIKYDRLVEKVPSILLLWHANFEQLSPICNYLIRSVQHKRFFDAPDFLIIAQALDGYYKRFVNKQDNKNVKKYHQQIMLLLNTFNGVHILNECRIDAEELTHSRHKYSHLIPDDDKKVEKAVAGEDLYYLTQKCIVLLTCCILDNIGLTTKEINICIENSAVERLYRNIPPTIGK